MLGRVGTVVEISEEVNDDGAKIQNTMLDMGGDINNNIDGEHFTDPGNDSQPLPIDYAMLHPTTEDNGNSGVVIGYQDVTTDKLAKPGEKRIYARDENGVVVAEVYLKNSGELLIKNDEGSITIAPDGSITITNSGGASIVAQSGGDVVINGTTFKAGGVIESTTATFSGNVIAADFLAGAITLLTHVHGGVTSGPSTTGPGQ